jgi:hypothetical protein
LNVPLINSHSHVVFVLSLELNVLIENQQWVTGRNQLVHHQKLGQALKDDWHKSKPDWILHSNVYMDPPRSLLIRLLIATYTLHRSLDLDTQAPIEWPSRWSTIPPCPFHRSAHQCHMISLTDRQAPKARPQDLVLQLSARLHTST